MGCWGYLAQIFHLSLSALLQELSVFRGWRQAAQNGFLLCQAKNKPGDLSSEAPLRMREGSAASTAVRMCAGTDRCAQAPQLSIFFLPWFGRFSSWDPPRETYGTGNLWGCVPARLPLFPTSK